MKRLLLSMLALCTWGILLAQKTPLVLNWASEETPSLLDSYRSASIFTEPVAKSEAIGVYSAIPAESCEDVELTCSFNGYSGSTVGWAADSLPLGWCGEIHNDQWFGFVAGSTQVFVTITPSNCANGDGLQAALYPYDCIGNPIVCNGGCPGCQNHPITLSASLVLGEKYKLVIDGYTGDGCNFTINALPSFAFVAPPVSNITVINGPAQLCPGTTAQYSIDPVSGAGYYTWSSPTPGVTFNGIPSPATLWGQEGTSVYVTFPIVASSSVPICVQATNGCNSSSQICKNVTVAPIPPTILPKALVCYEDAPYELPWGDYVTVSGTYSYTLENYLGCDSVVRQQVQFLPPKITNLTRYLCAGECYSICGSEFCEPGVYSEVCESWQGCDSIVNLTLYVLNPVAEIIAPSTVLSCETPSLTLNTAASPNSPVISIKTWKNLTTGQSFSGSSLVVAQPGVYVLTTSMIAGGVQCKQTDTVVITSTLDPLNIVQPCSGMANGSISAPANSSSTYIWYSSTGLIDTVNSISNLVAGIYTSTVTAANGCTNTLTITLTNQAPFVVNISSDTLSCAQAYTILTPSTSTSVLGPLTYQWSGPGGFTATLANPIVTVSGIYQVIATNAQGCTGMGSEVVVQLPEMPLVTTNQVIQPCFGQNNGSIDITVSGGVAPYTYSWMYNNTLIANTQDLTGVAAGQYTCLVTAANACTSTFTIWITSAPELTTFNSLEVLECSHPIITLTVPVSGAVNYMWSGPDGFTSSTANPMVSVPGVYSVTISNMSGCTGTGSIIVAQNVVIPVVTANQIIGTCSGQNNGSIDISVSSALPPFTYAWFFNGNPIGNTEDLNNVAAGQYTCSVTAANGCTALFTAEVPSLPNLPTFNGFATLDCSNPSAMLTIPLVGIVSYQWSGPEGFTSTLASPVVPVTGTYNVVVTNAQGCTGTGSIVVLENMDAPEVITSEISSCYGQNNGSVSAFAQDGVPPYTYAWYSNGMLIGTTSTINNLSEGAYTCTVTGANGCTAEATSYVFSVSIPTFSAIDTLDCAHQTISLGFLFPNVVAYQWSGPGGFSSTEANPVISEPGNYEVTTTNNQGCTGTGIIFVIEDTVQPTIAVEAVVATCFGQNTGGIDISVSGTPGPYTYSWLNNGTLIGSFPNISGLGEGTYTCQVTAKNGCSSTLTLMVPSLPALPTFSGVDTLDCAHTNVEMDATLAGIVSYQWSSPGGFSSSLPNPVVAETGTYQVIFTNAQGCTGTGSFVVLQSAELPTITTEQVILPCFGENNGSIDISVTGGVAPYTYLWFSNGNIVSNTQDADSLITGPYTCIVSSANGCNSQLTVYIPSGPASPVFTLTSTLNCTNTSLVLDHPTPPGTQTYQWSGPNGFNSSEENPTVVDPGIYTVILTNAQGCTYTGTYLVLEDNNPPLLAEEQVIHASEAQNDGSITVTSAGAISFAWYLNGNLIANTANISNLWAATYTCVATGANGCTTSIEVTVLEGFISSNEPAWAAQNWIISPNPSNGHFVLTNKNGAFLVNLSVYNASGQLVWRQNNTFAGDQTALDFSAFANGSYWLDIRTESGSSRHQLIKQ